MLYDVCQEGEWEDFDVSPLQVTHARTHARTLSLTPPIRLLPEPDCEGASIRFTPQHTSTYADVC
jgi:hypothetical protein